ncbi:MAG: hypothetical protein P4K83_00075, partial [Terracidiphilus sp.]|nr:hypothetical protein [Terracidiphilus sp.]
FVLLKSGRKVTNESKDRDFPLLHVHVCVHCGSAFRREVFTGRAITSGVYRCPNCGIEGPLNIEIRETQEPEEKDSEKPEENRSSS